MTGIYSRFLNIWSLSEITSPDQLVSSHWNVFWRYVLLYLYVRVYEFGHNTRVCELRNNTRVCELWHNTRVCELWHNTRVCELWHNTRVCELWHNIGNRWYLNLGIIHESWVWELWALIYDTYEYIIINYKLITNIKLIIICDCYLLLFIFQSNYRPPSRFGVDIPTSEHMYNADPSGPRPNDRFRISKVIMTRIIYAKFIRRYV